jgi:hypothetical protein
MNKISYSFQELHVIVIFNSLGLIAARPTYVLATPSIGSYQEPQ